MASNIIWIGVFLMAIFDTGVSIRYCDENADCEDLGDLSCVKSMCTWGICGCNIGYASRFVGTNRRYQCVKIKKIGERCSTDETEGVCGAPDSYCKDGRCQCQANFESRWDGETCLAIGTATVSETCNPALNAGLGSCDMGLTCQSGRTSLGDYAAQSLWGLSNSPFDEVPSTCVCADGQTAALSNDDDTVSSWKPYCRSNRVGDPCFRDTDCTLINTVSGTGWMVGSGKCVSDVCTCPGSDKADITGLFCASVLGMGAACAWNNNVPDSNIGVCDGSIGLRCGNPCDLETLEGHGNHTCTCDPGWKEVSGTCTKRVIGDTCTGDQNCRTMSGLAVCTDGVCQEYSTAVLATCSKLTIIITALFYNILV